MINDNNINKLRDELNRLINEQADFEEIQNVSRKLDECLVNYYNSRLQRE